MSALYKSIKLDANKSINTDEVKGERVGLRTRKPYKDNLTQNCSDNTTSVTTNVSKLSAGQASRNEQTDCELVPHHTSSPALISRNIIVEGKRTSIRLEQSMWDALEEICARERRSLNQLCNYVHRHYMCSSFTAAVRVFTLAYFRTAATENGHATAGHGCLHTRAC